MTCFVEAGAGGGLTSQSVPSMAYSYFPGVFCGGRLGSPQLEAPYHPIPVLDASKKDVHRHQVWGKILTHLSYQPINLLGGVHLFIPFVVPDSLSCMATGIVWLIANNAIADTAE